jgi:NAD(P)-dependent dehydrogenase (short-subunit alcohol dehydrogenase family)
MAELDGKVAVITGGASGMGEATVRRFVDEGARVMIADLNSDAGEALASELGDAAEFRLTDVSRESDIGLVVDEACDRWGALDIMFNNAGFGGVRGPIESVSEEEYDITMDVLLKGVFFGIKHAAPRMKAAGGGSIINTASVAGLQCGEAPHLYSVAKAAVIHLTKTVALELGEHGIRVNAICPGVIATPLAAGPRTIREGKLDKFRENMGRTQPIGRVGEPEDIANLALFLAGDQSTFITGTAQVVDGGANAGRTWRRQHTMMTTEAPVKLYRPPGR